MKTAGVVKLLIIVINMIIIFVLPWPIEPEGLLTSPTIPFVFMSVVIPCFYLLVRKEKKENLKWPNWNVNLFNPQGIAPFGNVDFFGVSFTTIGLAMVVSNKLNYNVISQVGLTSISFGLGILSGLILTIVIGKKIRRLGTDV